MSKKLDETFNLRSMDDLEEITEKLESINEDDIQSESDEIVEHVREMNEVYETALKAHKEIIDLGYTVDTKYAGGILSTSATFLDIAIKASKSKIENRLKKEKMELDLELKTISKTNTDAPTIVDGEEVIEKGSGELLSRNDVLEKLSSILKNDTLLIDNDDTE